jgi:hypothetical protein
MFIASRWAEFFLLKPLPPLKTRRYHQDPDEDATSYVEEGRFKTDNRQNGHQEEKPPANQVENPISF